MTDFVYKMPFLPVGEMKKAVIQILEEQPSVALAPLV